MRPRVAGLLLAVLLIPAPAAAQSTALARERVTLHLGGAAALPACHEFSVEQYSSSSCKGTVGATLAAALRAPSGFLFRPEVGLGGGYDTDLVGAHYFGAGEPVALEDVRFSLGASMGYAGAIPHGEARIAGGPRLAIEAVPMGVRSAIGDAGFDVDPHGEVSLAGEFHLEVDWDAAGKVRLGPRLRFVMGNQVFMMSSTECSEDGAWCDDVLLLNGDVEMAITVSFFMSLPSSSPVGFFFEAGPRLDVTAYTGPQLQSLFERHYTLPQTALEVAPWVVVGAEFRLGGDR